MAIDIPQDHAASIDPKVIYTLGGFMAASGIGYQTICKARREGITINDYTFKIGRRQYLKGKSAITYMQRLAEHQAAKEAK